MKTILSSQTVDIPDNGKKPVIFADYLYNHEWSVTSYPFVWCGFFLNIFYLVFPLPPCLVVAQSR